MNDCIWWADCYSSTLIEGSTERPNVVIESLDRAACRARGSFDPVANVGESTTLEDSLSSVLFGY